MRDDVRPCIMYKDPLDCDKPTCTTCHLFGTGKSEPEMIGVEVVYGCTHVGSKIVSIDDAGPEIAMSINELCPSCQQKIDDEQIDLWDRDNMSFDSEY